MRKRMEWPTLIAFQSLIALGAGLFPAGAGNGMTLGDRAVRLARASGITAPDADSERAAMMSLRKAGIDRGRDAGATDAAHASCQGRESRAGREGTPASPADPSLTAPPCEPQP